MKCVVCGAEFCPARPTYNKYCSDACRREAAREYERRRPWAQRQEQHRRWCEANRDRRREQNRRWIEANRDQIRERDRLRHRRHPELKLESGRRYREANRARRLEADRLRHAARVKKRACVNCGMRFSMTPPSVVFVWPTKGHCSSECFVESRRRSRLRWENANRVQLSERARLRYAEQYERINELQRLRRAADPERESERKRLYREANPELVREQRRRYREANRDRLMEDHRNAHRELVAAVQVWRELVGPASMADGFVILRALKQIKREEGNP